MTLPFERPGHRVAGPKRPELRRFLIIAAVALFVVLFLVPWAAGLTTDWLWFKQVGFGSVFVTTLKWRIGLFVVGALVAYGILGGNVLLATRHAGKSPALYINRPNMPPLDVSLVVPRMLRLGAIFVAFLVAVSTSALWTKFAQAFHGVAGGSTDALFGRDVGYYMFTLPAVADVLGILMALVVLSLGAASVVYVLRGQLPINPRHGTVDRGAELHVGALVAALFLLVALRLWLVRTAELLYSQTGPLVGASYADVHFMLPAIRISALAAVAGMVLALVGAFRGRLLKYVAIGVVVYAVVGVVGRGVIPVAVEKLVVLPNELTKETPYLVNHIAATRDAWGLDHVQTRSLSGEAKLTMADIKNNAATINNVRLWERDLLQQTFKQLQEIRTYYDFVSVNDDRYTINGDYRQVHVSARELNSNSLPTQSFINNRLTYTHGMGLTMAPVNEVTNEGLPVLFIKDLPPVSTVGIKLTRPGIYYGQLTNSYVFVDTRQKEFDYPSGEDNIYTSYTGTGGVPVGSVLRRALFAWRFGSLTIFFSDDITGSARVMYHRNIMDRVRTALPFLEFDSDPYLVVRADGSLMWILDGYTTSSAYPYSKSVGNVNYMRNSVKVTIDAFNGAITAYVIAPDDPVIQTDERIYGGSIFQPMSAMPADIKAHLRYPATLFGIQAQLQATYHMDEPAAFYHREDERQNPTPSTDDGSPAPMMRHIIMKLPGESQEEFIFMVPFTPRGKNNLAAWMVARMDGNNYGQLMVYRFPKQSLVYGPKQIENRINQDTDISRQITLWDQRGSQVIHGELLVIPIEESLVYVQPLFLRATGGSIPEMKRVIVASGNEVTMAETLDQALDAMFGGGAVVSVSGADNEQAASAGATTTAPAATTAPGAPMPAARAALLRQAQSHYDKAIAAQRAGDWAAYGREIQALGEVLKELRGGA
jgi:uncharacterized membrane protein (UPF0182 family)